MTGQEEIEDTIRQLMIHGQVQEIMAGACSIAGDGIHAAVYGNKAKMHYRLAKQLAEAIVPNSQ